MHIEEWAAHLYAIFITYFLSPRILMINKEKDYLFSLIKHTAEPILGYKGQY